MKLFSSIQKYIYCCGGIEQLKMRWKIPAISLVIINLPPLFQVVFQCCFTLPQNKPEHTVCLIGEFIFIILYNSLFFITSCKNPGIIPSASFQLDYSIPAKTSKCQSSKHTLFLQGYQTQTSYCDICCFYKLPRTIHCKICNVCIENHDHHSYFSGSCIGARNFKEYIYFLGTLNGAYFLILMFTIILLLKLWMKLSIFWRVGVTLFNFVLVFGLISLSSLFWYHIYLISTNQTLREHIKGQYIYANSNPFSRYLQFQMHLQLTLGGQKCRSLIQNMSKKLLYKAQPAYPARKIKIADSMSEFDQLLTQGNNSINIKNNPAKQSFYYFTRSQIELINENEFLTNYSYAKKYSIMKTEKKLLKPYMNMSAQKLKTSLISPISTENCYITSDKSNQNDEFLKKYKLTNCKLVNSTSN